ncbi:BamA/TamA family outer membrane protein [Hymenobacter caeli]|uniref:Outer membrane translocation and assembly module TamA n=1 Tax=Hymenobacter caeli TaxID=2735894 RepID=A0ABX2FNC1_9BACT|nr:BamA/TamA family outer membrane protein [Hymenobacter caeli]NRT18638.1 outer membrane translocation and assembly module TamA [Hymenobacter caeli]
MKAYHTPFLSLPHASALALLLLLSACSGLKYVPAKEKLYTGSTVKIEAQQKPKNESALQTELESVVRPKPNFSFLGLRPKLFFWHLGVGKTKGFGHFLAGKLGEAPVLLSQVKIPATENLMLNRLYNHGFFEGKVAHEVKEQEKTAQVNYTATVSRAYTIRSLTFPPGDTLLNAAIRATQPGTLLKVGDPYDLNVLTNERLRIDEALKNQGYYYFSADALLFQVDSTYHKELNVFVTVKGSTPARSRQPYKLRQVTLNTNYVLTDTTSRPPIMADGFRYFPDETMFRAKAITRATFLFPDSLYRRKRRDQTLSRLMSLGTFKFVEIRFRPVAAGDSAGPTARYRANAPASLRADSTALGTTLPFPALSGPPGLGRLDADVLMTQLKKKSLRAELGLVSKSNGFVGPGLKVTYRNHSAFHGAEQLLLNAVASTETQSQSGGEGALGLTSYELGLDAQLLVPRLIVPNLPFFNPRLVNSDFQPRTTFGAGAKLVTRAGFFSEQLFNANYGYSFKTKITNEQQITPIDVSYVRLSNVSDAFTALLAQKTFLQNSFREQFILASSYRYTYNQQVLEQRRQQIYFQGGLETSGNLAALVSSKVGTKNDDGKYTIGNQVFSQYAKLDLEIREYYRLSDDPAKGNRLVGRLLAGVGRPYGNSDVLPYIKQYGIGGPNSVRAFAARGIGPGTYKPTGADVANSFYDQVGDIRLEGNVEYRQDLFPYVKGALFMDAGNIWLVNDDPARPGGQFKAGSFLNQLAVGAGAGIRIDVQFFVIRFDYAVPLRAGYGTPTDDAGNPSRTGRLNLAIGYPF